MSGTSIWRKAGYRSRKQAITERFEMLDAATREARECVERLGCSSRVTNDGQRVLVICNRDRFILPLDPAAVILAARPEFMFYLFKYVAVDYRQRRAA